LRAVVAGLSVNDEAFICRSISAFTKARVISDQDLLTELKRTHLDDEPSPAFERAINNGPSIKRAFRPPEMRRTLLEV